MKGDQEVIIIISREIDILVLDLEVTKSLRSSSSIEGGLLLKGTGKEKETSMLVNSSLHSNNNLLLLLASIWVSRVLHQEFCSRRKKWYRKTIGLKWST